MGRSAGHPGTPAPRRLSVGETAPVEVRAGGLRWRVAAQWRAQLLDANGLRIDEWLQAGQARVVKHGPHRTVYHVTLPDLDFYVKHYRLMDTRAWLRELVRPAKARMEYDRARAVAARRIPTVEPLAVGCTEPLAGPGDSFLVLRTLIDAVPLNAFLEEQLPGFAPIEQTRLRQTLAEELGAFLARMHDAGIVHWDLHPGNLLVRLDDSGQPHLALIDLHSITVGTSLDWAASRANLILLNRWFTLRASRSDRLRFWRAYSRFRVSSPDIQVEPELVRDLERRTLASNVRFWLQRDGRSRRRNRYYRPVRSAAAVGYAVADLDPATLEDFLADPEAPFRQPGARLLKDSRSGTVAELTVKVAGVSREVIYKRFRVTTPTDPWVALIRRPPALRSWIAGHGLRERELPTPRPLLVLHRRRHGLLHEGYLLTEKIPAARDLRVVVDALPPGGPLRKLIDRVAGLVRDMHRRRVAQRDLKAANILLSPAPFRRAPANELEHLWLIDLVGVSLKAQLPRRLRIRDLTRLHASFHDHRALTRTDKLRFLRAYLQWGLFGRQGWKRWWHEVELATRVKIARNEQTGRVLR
jgi:tRNA A-37 threonylcarbamoyl transferase component Bud32